MIKFNDKKVFGSTTLGERLARLRQENKYSLEEVANHLGIEVCYLEFLEKGQYQQLPGEVYIKSFLKKYAEFLEVNSQMVMNLYAKERQIVAQVKKSPSPNSSTKDVITPKRIRFGLIIIIVIACLIYLGWQIKMIFAPPGLTISSPPDNLITNQASITVEGQTEPEASITINDQAVLANPEGNFSKQIDLQKGINTITISVSKERSQTKMITRQVLYKLEDGDNN